MAKPNRMGSTFAERKAAREGSEFKPPVSVETGNTTFAERTGKAVKVEPKQVEKDDEATENKAVKSSESKSPARKKS